ncbi:hypothetical protein D2962_04760 [Biomaibacter acetigenes]|uniref:Diaminopimelate epimerase n=1 Tax=Biomaibacter acetigenes TaxID=2316383 RepID=A0A3G2R3H3_9FIRM|nr:hypothetical protein [Biomaibacter acetigenes]AYO30010.1 hypothetical protein D2962_04760 [Biomaibacter acetigenes]RKL63191.1 hypothetical protein DXT63_07235 [Thermoanaerobacteraceae bacterium SP2]
MKLNFIKMSPCQNTTVFITEYCPKEYYIAVAREVMNYDSLCAEQVGFIVPPKNADSVLGMEMAGGEFCGNASLCAAVYVRYSGIYEKDDFFIDVSGASDPLRCHVEEKSNYVYSAECEMPFPISVKDAKIEINKKKIKGSIIDFKGISHFIFKSWRDFNDYDKVMDLIKSKIESDAIGIVPYIELGKGEYEIKPYVYVRSTQSHVFEKGCGSGSMALGVYLKKYMGLRGKIGVMQPGGTIGVEVGDKNFISSDVKITCEGSILI